MVTRLLVEIAAVTLISGCGSTAVMPSLGEGATSAAAPTEQLTWPSVEPPSPSVTPTPTSLPTDALEPTSTAPRTTPSPTVPPLTSPWVDAGVIDLGAPDSWRFDFVQNASWSREVHGILLTTGDVLLIRADGQRAALRDPRSGRWREVPGLPAVRTGFGLVALGDGSALAVGGLNRDGVSFSSVYRLEPHRSRWQRVGELVWARSYPGVALLPDGRVLVAGGSFLNGTVARALDVAPVVYRTESTGRSRLGDLDPGPQPVTVPYASVEIFDPGSGKSVMTAPMGCARDAPGVTSLSDGRILVTDLMAEGCGVAEIYDPATGSFRKTGDLPPIDTQALVRQGLNVSGDEFSGWYREDLAAPVALGQGGALLQLDQWQKHGVSAARSFRYRPATNSWVQFGPTAATAWLPSETPCTKSYSLSGATLVPLSDGRAFVVGGSIPCLHDGLSLPVRATHVFDPARNTWSDGADLPTEIYPHDGLQLRDGSVLLIARFGDYAGRFAALRYVFGSEQ